MGGQRNLCDTFRRRSFSTWNILRKCRQVDFQLLEETLTDQNLLDLKIKHPLEVITQTFTKPREGVIGADWEWWLNGPSGSWLGFRIQAKVIDLRSDSYKHLHYKSPSATSYQSDLLIESALTSTPPLIPLYCLYSNWNPRSYRVPWPCGSFEPNLRTYGCSLASAFVVKALRTSQNENKLGSLLAHLRPWHCLVCCQGYGGGELPERAWSYWKNQFYPGDQRILAKTDSEVPVEAAQGLSSRAGIYSSIRPVPNPPSYVVALLERQLVEAPHENLRHLTVFREIEAPRVESGKSRR